MTTTVTLLPGPAGTPLATSGWTYTNALAFEPAGRYLAQIAQAQADNAVKKLSLYRRDGDQLTRLSADQPAGPLTPQACWWHPSGNWLIAAVRSYLDNFNANDVLYLWRRDGDHLTLIGPLPSAGPPIKGRYEQFFADYGGVAFDATGNWLAVTCDNGVSGLLSFDPTTGATALTYTTGFAGLSLAWHPTDTGLLAHTDGTTVSLWQRTGGTLQRTATTVAARTRVRWHPNGTLLVADTDVPAAYTYPALTAAGTLPDVVYAYDYNLSPGGEYFAGATIGDSDDDGILYWFVTLDEITATGTAMTGTLLQQFTGVGAAFTMTDAGAGISYLALNAPPPGDDPFGLVLYKLTGTAPAASNLYMKQPDGGYVLVGVQGQPISMQMPDGSLRTWPGSKLPLYLKQADGSWTKVLG